MQLRAEEISQIIKKQIQSYDKAALTMETGTILSVGDGIARVAGLPGAAVNELLEFESGARAYRDAWQLLWASEPHGLHVIEGLDLLIEFTVLSTERNS